MPTATAAAVKAPALPAIATTFFVGNFDFGSGATTTGGGGGLPNPANDGTLGKLSPPAPSPVLGFRFQSSSDSRFTHVTALYGQGVKASDRRGEGEGGGERKGG